MSKDRNSIAKKRLSVTAYLILVIFAIAVLSVVFLLVNYRRSSDYSFTDDGVLDLRDWNDDSSPIILGKGWQFYPHQLLTPEDVRRDRRVQATTGEIEYNCYENVQITTEGWRDLGSSATLKQAGSGSKIEPMESFGVGTYCLDLIFSSTTDYVTINLPNIAQSARIWVNGKTIRHFGIVSTYEAAYVPEEISTDIQVEPSETGHVEIIINCANFSAPNGGILCSPCLASTASIELIKYSTRMYLAVLIVLWIGFLIGGLYISQTFQGKSKFYFFMLFFLFEILYENFDPAVTLLPGSWNYLLRVTILIFMNYFSFLFYVSLYPRGASKLNDKIRYFESIFFSLLSVLYILTYWCFPRFLYQRSSVFANFILILFTNLYCISKVFYMVRRHEHGHYLYTLSVIVTSFLHFSVFIQTQYYIPITLHAFILIFFTLIYGSYFIMDYVKTFEKLSFHNKNLESAVDEKTKYIAKVNQDLLRNHEKLLENEEARKKMLSNVSHDLRTPITAIRGYVELMLNAKEPLPREQEVQYLKNIHTRSTQMEQLISDLVQLTRLESENDTLDLMPISVKEMVHDLYTLYHAECEGTKKQVLFEAPDDDDLLIDGDAKKLLRVFENIIVNAMKYTREDGIIRIICHRYGDPAMLGGNAVEVIVKDNGVGIPPNEVPYVFDRFYRAENSGINKTGSGLGLSIVKSIMDKHGGKIWAESEEGQGSEFHIVFRASEFNFDEEPEEEE